MKTLLDTIRDTLEDVHIESGLQSEFDRVCLALEMAITEYIKLSSCHINSTEQRE